MNEIHGVPSKVWPVGIVKGKGVREWLLLERK
jgi:hypothetical protein